MAEVITMLALSPTMDEGTLVEWLKGEGDEVAEGELIAEIETDKATMEMESFYEGTILKLLAAKGDAVPVGAPLAIVGEEGEDISSLLADVESGAEEHPAPAAETAEAPEETEEPEPAKPDEAERAPRPNGAAHGDRIFASPLARRMAEDNGIDLERVDGSGPNGRIIKRDIEGAMERGVARPSRPVEAPPGEAAGHEVKLSQMRKTIARRLGEVWQDTPHFFLTMSIDMAAAMARRKEMNTQLEDAGVDAKISVNDLIVKACAVALRRFPAVNVSFRGDHLVQFDDVHVGVAVAIEDGLITPIVRNADTKPLSEISREVRELAERARDKRLAPEEYTGGTFAVSNLGMFGIDHFTAIINPPNAAILACGAVQQEPVVVDGELTVGTRMKVTMSCDHRAIDGAVGAQFLGEVKKLLENPLLMLI